MLLRLPPVNDILKYASISGSHSNMVLRLWYYSCKHGDGRLSVDQLRQHDPVYAASVEKEVEWDVVSAEIANCFPSFVSLAQSAQNSICQINLQETELQLSKRIKAFVRSDGTCAKYEDIAPVILRSQPPNPGVVPHLMKFIMRFGCSGDLMELTENFVRTNGCSGRSLGIELWDCLSMEVKHRDQEQLMLWRQACLKTMLCHQEKLLSLSDLRKSLTSKDLFAKILKFESMLVKLKAHGAKFTDLTSYQRLQGHGVFEVKAAVLILGKKPKEPHALFLKAETLEDAAFQCHEYWQGLSKVTLPSPWAQSQTMAPAGSSAAKACPMTRVEICVDVL